MGYIVKLENTNVICDVVKSSKKYSAAIRFSLEDHVIAEVKKLLLQKYPGSKCQKWACYERTIKSTAAPGTVIKAKIKRIAVIFPEPNKDGRRYEAHALLPDILLPNFQYSVPNLAVLIYSGEITRSADDEIVCSAEDKADNDDETGLGDKYEVFLSCICWLLAASEEMIEKGINRFSERKFPRYPGIAIPRGIIYTQVGGGISLKQHYRNVEDKRIDKAGNSVPAFFDVLFLRC